MSEENLEIVRRAYELMDQMDFEAVRELFDEKIELVNPRDAIESGTRYGRAQVIKALSTAWQAFASTRHEIIELRTSGDKVFALVAFHAQGRGSGAEIDQDEAHVWTLANGKVIRYQWFHDRDREAALEAAGLSE
jgi:ketosteroid isomerase-like protein